VRGRMRLHECDMHLERARLEIALQCPPEARRRLERAYRLVEETGYHRRDESLEELDTIVREAETAVKPGNKVFDGKRSVVVTGERSVNDVVGNVADVLTIQRRRLQKLKEQAAYRGVSAPPEVLMEINDLEQTIAKLDAD
jgi:hypothetical protein